MGLFRRKKKRPDRRMVWVTTTQTAGGGDKRFVLKIELAYAWSTDEERLLFEGEYPSRWQRWRALRGWWRANRKQYWYTNFMVDFDAWS